MAINVIVVEDDFDSLEVLSEYLSLKELNVLAKAKNGKEAVEIYRKFKPDIVLLDVLMPGYDGFYAVENIKKIDPKAKIIFVTAATMGNTQRKLFEYDVDGIIFKPFEMDYLLDTIENVKKGIKVIPSTTHSGIEE